MNPQISRQGSFFSGKTVRLNPGETKAFDWTGQFFRVLEATGSFFVTFDNGEELPADLGLEFRLLGHEVFKRVALRNPSATEVLTLTVTYGLGQINDNRLNVVPVRGNMFVSFAEQTSRIPDTPFVGFYSGPIPALSTITLSGAPDHPNGFERRKALHIQNADPSLDLVLEYEPDEPFWLLRPGETLKLETDERIILSNKNPVPIFVSWVQIFYRWQTA